jgi:hypothetical protein
MPGIPIPFAVAADRLSAVDGRRPLDKNFWANSSEHSYPELIEHGPEVIPTGESCR